MGGEDLLGALSKLVARRRKEEGEFSYVYLASGSEVEGKKAVYKMLKNDGDVYDNFQEEYIQEDETPLSFDSRCLKLLTSVAFEDDSKTSNIGEDVSSHSSSTSKAQVVSRDWDAVTKNALSKLLSRRRLEGGEFTYVYVPLDKTMSGKKVVLMFLKSQTLKFNQLKRACKNPEETMEQFCSRILKQILVVPYEKEIEPMETDDNATVGEKRKNEKQSKDSKKVKLDGVAQDKIVFVDTEEFLGFNPKTKKLQYELTQIGAVEGTSKFFRPISPNKFAPLDSLGEDALLKMNLQRTEKSYNFKRGRTEMPCDLAPQALAKFLKFLANCKDKSKTLTLVCYRKTTLINLLKHLEQNEQIKKFENLVTSVVSMEEIFKERNLYTSYPLKPLVFIYNREMKCSVNIPRPCSEDLANMIQNVCNKMSLKNNFSPTRLGKPCTGYIQAGVQISPEKSGKIFNSNNFKTGETITLPGQSYDASTSKVRSKPPPNTPDERQTNVPVKKDSVIFSAVSQEVLYPVYNQPIVVSLNSLDENTKFVKFSLNKNTTKKAESAGWDIIWRNSTRVFWRMDEPYAFCHLCPNLESDSKNSPWIADMLDCVPQGLDLGSYKALQKTDEEKRNLSTKVSVDLVVSLPPGKEQVCYLGKKPMTIPVSLALKPGSLVDGNVKDFEFRPSDVLICTQSNIGGVDFVNKLVSVDKNQAVPNRAKVVLLAKDKRTLKSGQVLGSAILFQNDVKLLWQKKGEQSKLLEKLSGNSNELTVLQAQHGTKRPMKTIAVSRLYAQGSNPVLVKLDDYVATKVGKKFSKVHVQFSKEFNKVIDQNKKVLKIEKLDEKESIVDVIWKKNTPYAFIDIKIPTNKHTATVDFCDIIEGYQLGIWSPIDSETPKEKEKVAMSICVDFATNNVCVQSQPMLINGYLKFKDNEIDKAQVLETFFTVTKKYFQRLEILSLVFKPFNKNRLAPQKTSTNDMKVTLMTRSADDSPVLLNAREVIADVVSPDETNLLNFSACGKKVQAYQQQQEMDPMEEEYGRFERAVSEGRRGMPSSRARTTNIDWARIDHCSPYDDMDMHAPYAQEQRNYGGGGHGGGRGYDGGFGRGDVADMDYLSYNRAAEMGHLVRGSFVAPGSQDLRSMMRVNASNVDSFQFKAAKAKPVRPIASQSRNSLFEKARDRKSVV